jgi:RNA polymerase sigma-70 factor (ECF subfamily)
VGKKIDSAHFNEILNSHLDYVYSLAYRILGNAEDAKDAVQETFFKVYKKYEQYDAKRSLKNWLCAIAVNTSRDIYRSRKRQAVALSVEDQPVSDQARAQAGIESRLLAEEVLNFLAYEFRSVMVLFYVEGKPIKEIAKILKIPQVLVKVRLHRARKRILEKFK